MINYGTILHIFLCIGFFYRIGIGFLRFCVLGTLPSGSSLFFLSVSFADGINFFVVLDWYIFRVFEFSVLMHILFTCISTYSTVHKKSSFRLQS